MRLVKPAAAARFHCIDAHTCGNPVRLVYRGAPELKGASMLDRQQHFVAEFDWIRTALMYEPRGHSVMSGVVLTEPTHPEADIGVIFIETGGYLPMCGHDTIGVSTALVETGMVPVEEPVTKIALDTPAGLTRVRVEVVNGAPRVAIQDGRNIDESRIEQDLVLRSRLLGLTPPLQRHGEVAARTRVLGIEPHGAPQGLQRGVEPLELQQRVAAVGVDKALASRGRQCRRPQYLFQTETDVLVIGDLIVIERHLLLSCQRIDERRQRVARVDAGAASSR